ncbi:Similar to Pc21g02610 [Penicillium chrysogenum Wisconsin 54-1255]; acc. no. XP_002567325 [Pyronema omphalodes CBS 100304]|uniref:Similar to Pc21g02610 [Penicillium chrysogenum Wisconsin 54-1255] acc. no. XP_002567325 n=1 Tax=Pyronema omphalodes (strain CBS 100304) TaxID=1076935 RepID=U4LRX0_PYROM|nr:Similar to Pc21g02610 [Penicillium chrysogenum Wisconsin 54-1255]; acc. no. XP_002567325 [Pyronema omphalodes CBS 100304]
MTSSYYKGAGGITYTFVVEFACESGRDYYVKHDPVHLSFVKMVGNIVEKAQVIDFVPGKF